MACVLPSLADFDHRASFLAPVPMGKPAFREIQGTVGGQEDADVLSWGEQSSSKTDGLCTNSDLHNFECVAGENICSRFFFLFSFCVEQSYSLRSWAEWLVQYF